MCKWTKEDFDNNDVRATIPIYDFGDCGETITTYDIRVRAIARQRAREETPPAPFKPGNPLGVAPPPSTSAIGLLMFGAGVGLLIWLIRSVLHPKQPAHQKPTE